MPQTFAPPAPDAVSFVQSASQPPDPNAGPHPGNPGADPFEAPLNVGPDDTQPSIAPEPSLPAQPGLAPQAQPQQPHQSVATPQQQTPAWAQRLQQAGIDPSAFRSEDDLVNAYLQVQRQQSELEPYAAYGRQFLPYAQQFGDFLRNRLAPQQPEQPQQSAAQAKRSIDETLREHWSGLWKKPAYDPTWERLVKINPETGLYEGVSPYVNAQAVDGMNNYREWQRQAVNDLLNDPFDLTWKAMQPGIQELARQIVQEELASHVVSRDFQTLEQQYEQILYQHDQAGNRITDQFTGEPRWTPFGEHVVNQMHILQRAGITDPYTNFEYAVNSAKAMLYDDQMRKLQQQQQQPQLPVGAPPVPQQQQFAQPYPGYAAPAPAPQGNPFAPGAPAASLGPSPLPAGAPFQPVVQQPVQPQMPSMYGVQSGMNGQLPMGGGFVPQQQSFLDRARQMASHSPMPGPYQAAAPSGPPENVLNSEDFFQNAASQLGLIRGSAA